MRVAFISTVHGHSWPGSEFVWGDTARCLLEQGHQVFARCSVDFKASPVLCKLIEKGLIYDPAGFVSSRMTRLKEKFFDPLARLRNWQADVIVVSAGSAFDISYSFALSQFLLKTDIPFIPVCHFNAETFWVDGRIRKIMRKIYSQAAAAVFVSQDNHRITERQLAMTIQNYHIIPPPLPVWLDKPLAWPDFDGDCWNLACVARLEPQWKGQDVLFELLSYPEWRARNWCLNLYGEGEDKEYLQDLVEYYNLTERVNFVGFVKDRTKIWLTNHIQVFPTRGEGGPMVLTEGMICGRPAVITNCGNVREYVEDGVDGFISQFATPDIFSVAMERAWGRRNDWQIMGIKAHEKIKKSVSQIEPSATLIELINKYKK
ncbi:MAG: glycosyltransferase [Snowella sp.]|nr:glycosyltransferase [Snowella sp.]